MAGANLGRRDNSGRQWPARGERMHTTTELAELADLTAALAAALAATLALADAAAEDAASAVEDLADAVEAWGEEVTRLRRHLGRVVARLRVQAEEAEADRAAAARREVAGRETEAELWRKATATPGWLAAAEAAWLAEEEADAIRLR